MVASFKRREGAIMAGRVSKSQLGNVLVGRVFNYERVRGYGFIRTSDGEDIILSSRRLSKREWNKLCVGDYVRFTVGMYKDKAVAIDVSITKKMPRDLSIVMPNGRELEVRHITKFGRSSDQLFIRTCKRTYTFVQIGSRALFDGVVDIEKFWDYLTKLLVKYDFERAY